MKKYSLLTLLLLLQLLVYGRDTGSAGLAGQPLSFRENRGQLRDQQGNPRHDIDFVLQASGMTLYIGKGQLHYQFIKRDTPDATVHTQANPPKHYQVAGNTTISRLDVQLEGANQAAQLVKEGAQTSKYHYYTDDSQDGVTGVSSYRKITYKNIYPSIDWVLYTNGNNLKYDFIVHPGGKVADIQMKYAGAQSLELQQDGSLKVSGPLGSITEEAPYIYEEESKKGINGKFILNQNILSYETAPYKGTLVIDPGVDWATYFGGDAWEAGATNNITYDSEGYVYIAGITSSFVNLATTGAHQAVFGGGLYDAFLAKFDTLGELQWATYYGGEGAIDSSTYMYLISLYGREREVSVTADALGNVYIAGSTFSATGIATPGSYQSTGSSVNSETDYDGGYNGFLVKFNSAGIRQWGTYYGASTSATAFTSVACDPEGNVYAAGYADSSLSTTGALVTPGAHQTIFNASPVPPSWFPGLIPAGPINFNGLLVKFDSSGSRQWATYYGGVNQAADPIFHPSNSKILDVACDVSGNVYIGGCGIGGSVTAGTHQSLLTDDVKGFVSKFDPDGVQLWGSYLNVGSENGFGLFLDTFQHLYIAGTLAQAQTSDTLIVTSGCHQPVLINETSGSTFNGFLMQMGPRDGIRNWGTYYGAEDDTYIYDVSGDYQGNVYITGQTNSSGDLYTISTPGAYKDTFTAGSSFTQYDAFIAQFDSLGVRKWATYYGDTAADLGGALICDPNGVLYLAGSTSSVGSIATPGSHQDILNGSGDVFLVRWLPVDIAITSMPNPDNDTVCSGTVPFEVTVKNQGRMDLEDTLKISYSFTGPAIGNADFFFTDDLAAGAEATFDLGVLDMPFPGDYEVMVYLHISRGDQVRDNDTLRFTLTATNAEPVADIEVNQVGTVFHFSNPSAQPSDGYFWNFGDGETSSEANPSHEYAVTDTYQVTLIVTGFCGSDTATVSVAGIGGNGIDELSLAGKLSIYPNPAGQILYVTVDDLLQLESYSIVNVLGQEVQGGSLKMQNSLNVNGLVPGSYVIRIRTDKGMVSKQFQLLGR